MGESEYVSPSPDCPPTLFPEFSWTCMFMLFPEPTIPSNIPTVMMTLSGWLTKPCSFVTTSSNTIFWGSSVSGAVKVGFAAVESLRVTEGPEVCVHW